MSLPPPVPPVARPAICDQDPRQVLALPPDAPLWVFGYGSLMWDPGFRHAESRPGVLRGFHRRFCVYSHRYRGTAERPGLVLGLDRGGSCRGMLFKVAPEHVDEALAYLWEREMVRGVYRPALRPVAIEAGERIRACSFVVDRRHPGYCGKLCLDRTVELIRTGHGSRGPNSDYLLNTVRFLEQLGIVDRHLHNLADHAFGPDWRQPAGSAA